MVPNPARFVYGTVAIGALLAAEYAQHETYVDTVAAILLALLVYWLAHSYAEFTARRLRQPDQITLATLGHSMTHESPLLLGAAVPLLAVVACWIGGVKLSNGVSAGVWSAVAVTILIEVLAAVRSQLTGLALVLQSVVGLVLAALVTAIKLVLH